MKKRHNKFKIASILLLIVVLALAANLYDLEVAKRQVYDFNGFQVPRLTLESIAEETQFNQFVLCSIKDNKCITLSRIG